MLRFIHAATFGEVLSIVSLVRRITWVWISKTCLLQGSLTAPAQITQFEATRHGPCRLFICSNCRINKQANCLRLMPVSVFHAATSKDYSSLCCLLSPIFTVLSVHVVLKLLRLKQTKKKVPSVEISVFVFSSFILRF